MSSHVRCKLGSDGGVCLRDILHSFNAPILEEHAWALCYQCTKAYVHTREHTRPDHCLLKITELAHVFLQMDGTLHPSTFSGRGSDSLASRGRIHTERDFIHGLGFVVYQALDHGSSNGEERTVSGALEDLIEYMLAEGRHVDAAAAPADLHETDDEGIEKDADVGEEEVGVQVVQQVLQRCGDHLHTLSKLQIEAHYKAVVRALVTEALELSTFLERVAQGTSSLRAAGDTSCKSDLDQLQFTDWARFWVQVIAELRMGVKLRKVNYTRAPIEYELTPYEILMKEIRSCKFSLRKIMVNGDIPNRMTKDAHALILEFIRSRPPLRSASARKLAPRPQKLTPHEQLMSAIRRGRKLRAVRSVCAAESGESVQRAQPRKLIKVDFSQLEDEEEEEDIVHTDNSSETEEPGLWSADLCNPIYTVNLDAYDLATVDPEAERCARRHTLGVVEATWGSQSVPQSRPSSRQSYSSDADSLPPIDMSQSLHSELLGLGKQWPDGMSLEDRLSLTLAEIVHIRSVLTKAELEALPPEGHVRADVESRKVCFLCLKTRFGIFGPWGQRCLICKRTICGRCCSRVNIPMEHFNGVPVALISPSLLCTPEEGGGAVTEPSSIYGLKANAQPLTDASSPGSRASPIRETDSAVKRFRARASAVGRATGVVDKWKGSQMVACHDCKMMLKQIIKSARTNRTAIRNKTLQNMSLNLSPAF